MPQVRKTYTHPFILEPTKLTRLMEVIHARVGESSDVSCRDQFEVFMKGNRDVKTDSLEEVLALDNSKKSHIRRLKISTYGEIEQAHFAVYEVHLDFGWTKNDTKGESTTTQVLVSSTNLGWNNATLSAVEEQVERTKQQYIVSVITAVAILIVTFIFLVAQFGGLNNQRDLSRSLWIDSATLDRVQTIVNENRPLTEEESRQIETAQLRNLLLFHRPPSVPSSGITRRTVLFGLPLAAIIICSSLLVFTCYPSKIFLWGDEVARIDRLSHRRKLLWAIVSGIMIVGLLGKFLSEGILSWIPKS